MDQRRACCCKRGNVSAAATIPPFFLQHLPLLRNPLPSHYSPIISSRDNKERETKKKERKGKRQTHHSHSPQNQCAFLPFPNVYFFSVPFIPPAAPAPWTPTWCEGTQTLAHLQRPDFRMIYISMLHGYGSCCLLRDPLPCDLLVQF